MTVPATQFWITEFWMCARLSVTAATVIVLAGLALAGREAQGPGHPAQWRAPEEPF